MSSPTSRLSSLDGVRGIAALIVVVHHAFLVSPSFAAAYYGGDIGDGLIRSLAVYSPLHLLWAGAEAVVVFFVLSGFVLARAVQSPRFDWFSYFPSRIVRLWLPVVGAVALGALILLLPHNGSTASPWLDRDPGYPLDDMVRDLTLVGGTSGVISPLWTLRWEILFSLLLPVVAYAARAIPAWLFGVVCIGLSTLGAGTDVAAIQYLPIFGLGVAIAGEWDRISDWIARRPRRTLAVGWPLVVAAAILLLSSYWMLRLPLGYLAAHTIGQTLILFGATLIIIAAVHWSPLQRLLSSRVIAWLGAVSFSLYLVHEPILVSLAKLFGDGRLWIALPVGMAIAIAVAAGFWMAVERPATALSRWIGRAIQSRHRAPEPASAH